MTGEMACESDLRMSEWVRYGCNMFDAEHPKSTPIITFTEQDILTYIKMNNLKICSLYGVVEEIADNKGNVSYCTSGCQRTGCAYCGFGCQAANDHRFEIMKKTHPKMYDFLMKPSEEGGMNYKEIIDWLNINGNLKIKY